MSFVMLWQQIDIPFRSFSHQVASYLVSILPQAALAASNGECGPTNTEAPQTVANRARAWIAEAYLGHLQCWCAVHCCGIFFQEDAFRSIYPFTYIIFTLPGLKPGYISH